MSSVSLPQGKKNILELALHDESQIRLSLSESHGQGPIAFYQENEIALEKIDRVVQEIIRSLNKINVFKNPGQNLFNEFQKWCLFLYDELLSREIKVRLQNTPLKDLELIVDEQLVHIPWELLFDGQKFLCEQFNTGRQVRSKGSNLIQHPETGQAKLPLKMLIIADPTEDLEVAWKEGVRLYEAFQSQENLVKIMLQAGDQVDTDFVRKNFLDFDLVHYAGHADYEDAQPNQSGWILADGKLRAADILKMAGTKGAMPKFVFGNACQSGFTGKWEKEKITQGHTFPGYGLVHAFLMTGVQHYLGTFCEISDAYSASMGLEFYRHLFEGKSIGEALRRARISFREKYGEMSFSWINYVLYGHPGDYLIPVGRTDSSQDEPAQDMARRDKRIDHVFENSDYGVDPRQAMTTIRHSRSPIPHWAGWERWMGKVLTFCLLVIVTSGLIFFSWGQLKSLPFLKGRGEDVGAVRKQERIEELKSMIYEKLKAREERQSVKKIPEGTGAPEDTWTSEPFVIAVFNISEQDKEILPGWAFQMILDLERKLTQILVEDNRIRVAERKELDRLLEEKDLQLSDFSLGEQKDLFGRFLYARMMFFLHGYRASDGLALCYRIVDTGTGEIEKINSGLRLIKSGKPEELARLMHAEMKELMNRKFPLRGRITMVRDNLVVLNIGTGEGVREEDIFEVLDSEQEGGRKRKIGRIKALGGAVEASKTACIILEGKGLAKGLWVEIAAR